MTWYLIIKTIHILSSTILFGTGIGIAFFMFRTSFTDQPMQKHFAATNTVLADTIFTLPAVFLQPLSGAWLVWQGGYDWSETWLLITYVLYLLAGACWIPVVWIQIELKKLITLATETGTSLPTRYNKLFKIWFALGWPAFVGLTAIFYLMVAKPA